MSKIYLRVPARRESSLTHTQVCREGAAQAGTCLPILRRVALLTLPVFASASLAAQDLEFTDLIRVVGQGESRATNAITFEDFETQLPGLSLEKSLDAIPGVNVRSTDPFGFYEFGNDIRIRSFDISRLAVTVDDVPMGQNSPRYGTPAGRVADPENILTIQVSQGTGDVTTPAIEALGGSIMYYTRDPSEEMGAMVKWSIGDFDATRLFARFETGELWSGFTSYISTSRFQFRSTGVPEYSRSIRMEAKAKQEFETGSFTLSYTWNDRDDFDTRNIQWDRWRALETGDPYAGYGTPDIYNESARLVLETYAANGYVDYRPEDFPEIAPLTNGFFLGNKSDRARNFGPTTYMDPTINMGDGINSRFFNRARNGRMDHFLRGRLEMDLTDDLSVLFTPYFQDKSHYGLFNVARGDSRTQLQNAYRVTNFDSDGNLRNPTFVARPDIWPEYLFHDGSGNLVSLDTPGAIPMGYNDLSGDGFYSTGDTLNPDARPDPFTPGHALAVRDGTDPALNGATARDEDFGGERYGAQLRFEYEIGNHRIRTGVWVERDKQSAYRPTYMLEGDSVFGDFLYDRVLFLNYDQNFKTDSFVAYIEDQITLMDGRLGLNLGFKLVNFDREASGILTTPLWWNPEEDRSVVRGNTYKDNFLPQVGATYQLSDQYEIFGSYAENLAAPQYNVVASDTFTEDLRPETSKNYDLGLRYFGQDFSATFAVFYNEYNDRILSVPLTQEELIAAGLSGVTGATRFRNVGGVDAYGAEIAFDWRTPVENLRLIGSFAYQVGKFQEDLNVGYQTWHDDPSDPRSVFYEPFQFDEDGNPTLSRELQEGKRQGNTPEFTASLDARYNIGGFGVDFGLKYYDSVYVNTLNTEKVPSYTVANAAVTYRFGEDTALSGFRATLSVDNLFDKYFFYAGNYTGSFNGNVRADYGRNVTFTVTAEF
ncbi:MAG: TonB-dependent receptor [Opitutales bacterium]|nr:TonB-dependent receptor [Opitutales bacterium]